eukprot:9347841-Pyramimonas_sp.AAC.2
MQTSALSVDVRLDRYLNGPSGLWVGLFIYSKIPELLDTVFLVLQKKRVIFLAWFHHTTGEPPAAPSNPHKRPSETYTPQQQHDQHRPTHNPLQSATIYTLSRNLIRSGIYSTLGHAADHAAH